MSVTPVDVAGNAGITASRSFVLDTEFDNKVNHQNREREKGHGIENSGDRYHMQGKPAYGHVDYVDGDQHAEEISCQVLEMLFLSEKDEKVE